MSLEDAITKLTAAVTKQNEILESMRANAGKPAGTAAAAGKPATAATAAAGKPAAPKLTVEKVQEAFTAYLNVPKGPERDARKTNAVAVLTQYGAAKAGEIPEANWKDAIEDIKTLAAGGVPAYMTPAADDDGGDGESLI